MTTEVMVRLPSPASGGGIEKRSPSGTEGLLLLSTRTQEKVGGGNPVAMHGMVMVVDWRASTSRKGEGFGRKIGGTTIGIRGRGGGITCHDKTQLR